MLSFLIKINTKLNVNIFEIIILSQVPVTLNKINAYIDPPPPTTKTLCKVLPYPTTPKVCYINNL